MNKQNKQLTELSDEELKQVTGGEVGFHLCGGTLINDAHCIAKADESSPKVNGTSVRLVKKVK